MKKIYKNRINQEYEEYWKFTASKIDYNNKTFIKSLEIIVDHIDKKDENAAKNKISYKELQKKIAKNNGFLDKNSGVNSRKEINTWIKNGFVNPGLKTYHCLTKDFLGAKSKFEKNTLRAKIFLDNNQFNASVTKKDSCKKNRVKFLLRTLEVNKKLTKEDLLGIMFSNPDSYGDYLEKNQINELNQYAKSINALDRKYNQVGHLRSALRSLEQYVVFVDDVLHFRDDDDEIQRIGKSKNKPTRSQTEQRIFRDMLIVDSNNILGAAEDKSRCKCMLSGLPMSTAKLIASHIWAYDKCNEEAEYDPNNGLLLGENADYYFDKGSISFTDEGEVIFKESVPYEWKQQFKRQKINPIFLNSKRKEFLAKHRLINGF